MLGASAGNPRFINQRAARPIIRAYTPSAAVGPPTASPTFQDLTSVFLSRARSISRVYRTMIFRAFTMMLLCAGLIYQGSAAAAMPQSEPMPASDCAEMMQRFGEGQAANNQGSNIEAPCEKTPLDCMLALSAVSPALAGCNSPFHIVEPLSDSPLYLSGISPRLCNRPAAPDYPPPRT